MVKVAGLLHQRATGPLKAATAEDAMMDRMVDVKELLGKEGHPALWLP